MPAVATTTVTTTATGRGRLRVELVDGPIQRLRLSVALEGVDLTVHLRPSEGLALLRDVSRALEGLREVDRVAG